MVLDLKLADNIPDIVEQLLAIFGFDFCNGLIALAKPYPLVVDRRVQNPAGDMLADLADYVVERIS